MHTLQQITETVTLHCTIIIVELFILEPNAKCVRHIICLVRTTIYNPLKALYDSIADGNIFKKNNNIYNCSVADPRVHGFPR